MNSEKDLLEYWCWNKDCPDYGKKGTGNMGVLDYPRKKVKLMKIRSKKAGIKEEADPH